MTRVPLLSITGFLGAGKTTLVNHILRHAAGRRFAVIVNDFGALDIDYDLIDTVEPDRLSLKNGCVCCSLNGDLVAAVARFARQEIPPDAIVIEASGVAVPRSLDASIRSLEDAGLVRYDSGLSVFDAARYGELDYDDREMVLDHAACSDLVLVNKVDVVSTAERWRLRGLLDEAAPYALVLETVNCACDLDFLVSNVERPMPAAGLSRDLAGHSADHKARYCSWSYETERPIDRIRFESFVRDLPLRCLRAKGLLAFSGDTAGSVLFNLVGRRATLEPGPARRHDVPSRLVVIGKADRLRPEEIERAFLTTLT